VRAFPAQWDTFKRLDAALCRGVFGVFGPPASTPVSFPGPVSVPWVCLTVSGTVLLLPSLLQLRLSGSILAFWAKGSPALNVVFVGPSWES
jgi:hypothetical protein